MASILGRLRDRIAGSDEVDPLVAALRDALDDDRVKIDGAQRALLSHDASVFDGGNPGPVCYPETTDEVVAIMRIAEDHGVAVVPRGAGTGLAGGAIPMPNLSPAASRRRTPSDSKCA